jgi:hypothetical protein
LSIVVFGPPPGAAAGVGEADGAGDPDGAGDADAGAGDGGADCPGAGPGAGPRVSSGSALATTVDAAQPAIIRLAAANLAAVGIPPIEIQGTGVRKVIHIVVKSADQLKNAQPSRRTLPA